MREALTHWRNARAFAACALMRARLAADLSDPSRNCALRCAGPSTTSPVTRAQ
ncbi:MULTISPECIES: hypothetical protein [Streptomyces]|uniref:hypothetical protein n=1 Tax=Streptomyces TaxID=1883 RepID=UPI000AD44050|nr:hypothetical protein [Streptomyces durhamensis]